MFIINGLERSAILFIICTGLLIDSTPIQANLNLPTWQWQLNLICINKPEFFVFNVQDTGQLK